MKVFYSDAYVASKHEFDTTRKSKMVADSLAQNPIAGVEIVAPDPIEPADAVNIHDEEYVQAIVTGQPRMLAQSQGFDWDEGLRDAVLASTGGAVDAAITALLNDSAAGSLSSGLHHARRDRGAGFCTFNGIALAAAAALGYGAERVLVIDLDAHCGGGTNSIVGKDKRIVQLDVSVCNYDGYKPSGESTLDVVDRASRYIDTISARLSRLRGQFDLCIYNAGMDPFERCDIGGMLGVSEETLSRREKLVFSWCHANKVPVAFVLAGGYTGRMLPSEKLVELHRMTIAEAAAVA